MNLKEFTERVAEELDFGFDEVRRPNTFVWLPVRDSMEVQILVATIPPDTPAPERIQRTQQLVNDMAPPIFVVGSPNPLRSDLTIAAIFHDDEEARIYCVDLRSQSDIMNGRDSIPPTCYRLAKKASTFAVERMSLDVMFQEVVSEWRAIKLASEADEPAFDEERIDVLERLADAVKGSAFAITDPYKGLLGELLATEDPEDEEEEEEEDDEAAKGVAAPPSPPPPPPPTPPTQVKVPDRPVV